MAQHIFTLQADWPGGRNEVGNIEAERLRTQISIPPEMDGPGVGTNPDEMLLGAAATCYLITLAAMLERTGIQQESLTMTSHGIVDVTNGVFTYQKIIHQPKIELAANSTERQLQLVERLVVKAESTCMISKALRGNVTIELDPMITKRGLHFMGE